MNSGPVKIYSAKDTPRLKYIAGIILGEILGLQWEVITDKRKLGKHPVINYSKEIISGSFKIIPVSILFERGITSKQIVLNEWKGLPVFFLTESGSDLPFDIFATSFFLISRYEEYLEFSPDKYGRFPSSSSVAFKNGFLGKPVIDLWTREFAKAFLKRFPTLAFRRNEYKALLTVDTDEPFPNTGKNIFKSIEGLFHNKKHTPATGPDRHRVIANGENDPFDVFDYMIDNIDKNGTDVRFFFPVGGHSKFDKNPSWKNSKYRDLVHKIAEKYQSGLHPSFVAGGDGALVTTESDHLRSILRKEVTISRFHYLRLFLPVSYDNILEQGYMKTILWAIPMSPASGQA